jgi:Ubiquitinol-cytochrome C reductase Fe-S subunit TAT signal
MAGATMIEAQGRRDLLLLATGAAGTTEATARLRPLIDRLKPGPTILAAHQAASGKLQARSSLSPAPNLS